MCNPHLVARPLNRENTSHIYGKAPVRSGLIEIAKNSDASLGAFHIEYSHFRSCKKSNPQDRCLYYTVDIQPRRFVTVPTSNILTGTRWQPKGPHPWDRNLTTMSMSGQIKKTPSSNFGKNFGTVKKG